MAVKRRIIVSAAISLVIIFLLTGILLARLEVVQEEKTNLFTYPFSVKDKTYIVTLETNWNAERVPSVSLINSSSIPHAIELYFLGGTKKTISYNITIPTDLLWGNISLVWKYYLQNPNSYILMNNGTHNSLQKTFEYNPPFSGTGYFEILGTQSVW